MGLTSIFGMDLASKPFKGAVAMSTTASLVTSNNVILGKSDVIRGNASAGLGWQTCWMGENRINGYIPMRWIIRIRQPVTGD
jgi:hypothetical protein